MTEEVVTCRLGHCTWSSVRLAVESRLGNIVPVADEATSCVIPTHLCPRHSASTAEVTWDSLPRDGKTSNKHIPETLLAVPMEDSKMPV